MYKITLLCLVGLMTSSEAIVVQDYTTAEKAPVPGLDWSYVYSYKSSSSVSVGGHWLLTAAHVADDGGSGSISADGTTYLQQEIIFHPSADLALVRYDKTFPGFYSLYTDSLVDDPLRAVLMVGYGTKGSVRDYYWTDNGSGRGTRRWGSQEVDRSATRIYDVGGVSTVNTGFWMDFDLINTAYEAGTGVGDSGGGVFYDDQGVWKLAGISTERAPFSADYNSTFAVAMTDYADWINETIPEPYTTSLMGLSMLGLFSVRARERRRAGCVGKSLLPRAYTCDQFYAAHAARRPGFRMVHHLLIQYGQGLKAFIRPSWERVCSRYSRYDRSFWDYMVSRHERKTARRQAAKLALRQKVLDWLDACLARVLK